MQNQTIECPKCGNEFPINQALAGPIVEAERSRLQLEMRDRSTALSTQEAELQSERERLEAQQKKLKTEAAELEKLVQNRLEAERAVISASEAKRIEGEFQNRLNSARLEQETQKAKIAQLERAELDFRKRAIALDEEKRQLELTIARQLDAEREGIRQAVTAIERERSEAALAAKDESLADLGAQLAESRRVELEVRKQREALEGEKKSLELEVMRRLDEERDRVRTATMKQEEDRNHLKLAEKDKVIDDMRKQVEEMRRKSEQGSQQLQGEVQELELEAILRSQFSKDEFEPVAVGRAGGDILQKVIGAGGTICGTILWESKRTKGWQEGWLPKARDNQRNSHATVSVIATTALPKGITSFDRVEDVWVAGFECVVPLAKALRATLIQTDLAQLVGQDRSGKTDRMYSYVTGQNFKHRISAIVEAYVKLQEDLDREKRSVTAAWARRVRSHELILLGAAGMYGDLQGILGKTMPQIEGLEALHLDGDPQRLPIAEPEPLQLNQ
jgi:hypothetical protein